MRNPFRPGDRKHYHIVVDDRRLARFDAGLVHPVYGTFALGQDAEWVCRLFVLDMLEAGEEGVGSYLSVRHLAPAPKGATVVLEAELRAVAGNRVRCKWTAVWNNTLIADGEQEQQVVDAARFAAHIARLAAQVRPVSAEG